MKGSLLLQLATAASVCSAASISSYQYQNATLEDCVRGVFKTDASQRIVSPDDDTYTDARLGEKIQFEHFPALIAYATSAEEVGPLVKCAKAAGIKAVARTGGHHFEGYSALNDTLVIDIGHINSVRVSKDKTTAQVGAGLRLGELYLALDAHNATFVGGICPTVGLAGLVSSGGFNMQMRTLGISADYVLAADVVNANGDTIRASPDENADLFWAIRGGGGGTYGIVTGLKLRLVQMPRSAMVYISWNDTADRFPVAKRFLEWAPRTQSSFTSQVNVYKSNVTVLGWNYGASAEQTHQLLQESGLLQIGTPQVTVSGNCNTDNSRLFGYTTTECVADDKVDATILNVVPEAFSKVEDYPQFTYKEQAKSPSKPLAPAWPRYRRISKSYFVQKDKLMTDAVLQDVVDRLAQVDDASQVWGEWHAWNISGTSNNAFAWREKAYAHLEFQIHGSEDQQKQQEYLDWFERLEQFLRPALGPASYSGYADAHISSPHLESYYGDNVCRLINIKKQYDPQNFFTNPLAIPVSPPADVHC